MTPFRGREEPKYRFGSSFQVLTSYCAGHDGITLSACTPCPQCTGSLYTCLNHRGVSSALQDIMYCLGRKHVICEVIGCVPQVSVADVLLLFAFCAVFPLRYHLWPPECGRAAAYQRDMLLNSRGAQVSETPCGPYQL